LNDELGKSNELICYKNYFITDKYLYYISISDERKKIYIYDILKNKKKLFDWDYNDEKIFIVDLFVPTINEFKLFITFRNYKTNEVATKIYDENGDF
jgi:hypothetical protein